MDLGIHRRIGIPNSIMNVFIQAAFNQLNYTRVMTSSIYVINQDYSLINIMATSINIPFQHTGKSGESGRSRLGRKER